MKNFYIFSAAIIFICLVILVVNHVYYSPYNRCIRNCVVVGFTKEEAAAACARLHNSN